MKEKRKEERLEDDNEVVIIVVPREKNQAEEKIPYNCSKDISVSGTKIKGSTPLPVDTVLKIDLILKNLRKTITTLGKVKWIKTNKDNSYEAGVEFVNTPEEAVQKLKDYISWKKQFPDVNLVGMPYWIFAKLNKPKTK